MVEPLSRRERLRAETVREIKATARRVLVERGGEGLALRAIAREMGMSAPAIYRYFTSREELVGRLADDLYTEMCEHLEAARDAARPATAAVQVMAVSREFRRWATTHPAEFGLLFGSPEGAEVQSAGLEAAGTPAVRAEESAGPARRFGAVFATLVSRIYRERPFPIPAEEEIAPALRDQLRAWGGKFPVELPLGVMYVFMSCWIRLYGSVCMEIFGHLKFAFADAEPMFEAELRELAERLGIPDEYRPPHPA